MNFDNKINEIDSNVHDSKIKSQNKEFETFDLKTKEKLKETNEERVCPDGGWGWVVMVAALVIRIILGGLLVSFGLFITPLGKEYNTSQSTISWIASLLSASALAAAPLATLMAIKLSDRVIVIIGSVLASIAFSAPYFYSPLWFMFMSSILTGVGMAIAMMNTTIVLTKYFDRKLSIINGIFTSGTGIASFIITPIFDKLINLYGWRLSMLIYGVIFLFCGVCSLTFREVPKKVNEVKENDNTNLESNEKGNSVVVNFNGIEEATQPIRIQNFLSATNVAFNYNSDFEKTDERLFTSLQYIHNKEDNFERKQVVNLLSNMSVSTLLGMSISNNLNNKNGKEIRNITEKQEQMPLWKNYVFILFVAANFLTNLGHDTTFMFAKQRAIDMNITPSNASFLLIAIGIGNTIGRLLFGYLGSRKEIKTYILYLVSLILAGGFLIFSRFAFSYPLMLVYTIGFGLFIGSYTTLTSVVLLDIVGIRNFTKGLGITYFVQAIGLLICSPTSGAIYDATKTFHWSFINSGTLIFLSGFLLLLGYASKSFRNSQKPGPCSLEYSRVKNPELIPDDPDAGELIQRQKIQNQSGSTGIEAGKSPNLSHAISTSSLFWSSGSNQFLNKPALVNRQRRLTGIDLDEIPNSGNKSPFSTARQYVESLHQTSSSSLLFGKNNVYCQPREDVNKMPGYLSLHMAVNELLIKWTPNELMSGGLNDAVFKENPIKVEWDCALMIWVNKVVYIHCHQQADKGETLVLVNHDGSQNPPFDFPQGGHLMSFLTCLENGLLPKCRLDPPLWLKKNREKLFQKSCEDPISNSKEPEKDVPKSAEFIKSPNKNKTIFLWNSTDKNTIKFSWFHQPFNKKLTIGNRKVLSQPLEHIVFDYRQAGRHNSQSDELLTDLVFRIVRPKNYNQTMSESHSGDEDFDDFDEITENSKSPNDFHSNHQTVPQWQSEYTVLAMKRRCRLSGSEKSKNYGKSSIRMLCSSMKKEIMARSFYGCIRRLFVIVLLDFYLGLAYSRHMKTIRNHLSQLVLTVDLGPKGSKEFSKGLTKEKWISAFNLNKQIEDYMSVLRCIYRGGCDPELRVQIWPFLLGLFEWNSTENERQTTLKKWERRYHIAISDWMVIETVLNEEDDASTPTDDNEERCAVQIERKTESNEMTSFGDSISNNKSKKTAETKIFVTQRILTILKQNWTRIEKDVARCDRHFGFFGQTNKYLEKGEENLNILQRIMCTWVWENLELGYIQGMCDLLAPILVVFNGQEELTFACFSKFMERMISNFPVKDSTKMDLCFSRMRSAVQILDSDLLNHMQSYGDFTHFYFSYRWFLLDFKREFTYKDVFCLWETIWAADNVASPYFSLFVGLALLLSYRDVIIDNAMEFTDIIRFFNEMAEQHNVQKVLELARELVEKLQLLLHS